MSEDFLQSVENFLESVQQELSSKIKSLDSKLDKLTEDNRDLKRNITKSESIFKDDSEKFYPYNKILELEKELQNEKTENRILDKKIKVLQEKMISKEDSSVVDPLTTAEYILSHLKDSLFELVKTLDKSNKIPQLSSEYNDLDEEAKSFVSQSSLQSIDERITAETQSPKITHELVDLKQQDDHLSAKSRKNSEFIENLQRELSYRNQQVKVLQKIIDEGEIESDSLKNENLNLKNELENIKTTFETLEQKSHESFLEIERKERESKEAESTEDGYKNELEKLRLVLSKRKIEIKELKTLLSSESDKSYNVIEDYKKQIEDVTANFSDLESKYSYVISQLNEIVREGKNLDSHELIDLEDLLKEFKLLVKLSGRVYAPKGYLIVLNYLTNNPGWIDLHYLAKQINMNPGILHNLLLELVDMNLIRFSEEENKVTII
jgi:chromosome segregation ATPase